MQMNNIIEEQKHLISLSIEENIDFSVILSKHGMSYDDLVYSDFNKAKPKKYTDFIPVNERERIANGIPCVSFFSGAGGLDIGFESAGFNNIIDVEINEMFCDTLRKNGHVNIIGPPGFSGDISDYETIIEQLAKHDIVTPFPGVFHGGPPCQSFSIAANQRFSKGDVNFKRTGFQHEKYGNLLFCYIKIIQHFLPEVFLIENVDGLLTIDGGEQVKKACELLTQSGYVIPQPRVVNAADYGVPQKRLRTVIVGSRLKGFSYPATTLKYVPSGSVFAKSLANIPNHVTRKHSAESILRYMNLAYGARDKLGRVDRLDPDLPSKTIIAGGTGGGGRSHLHPYIPRTMSVRECARLQTFPDDYVFTGPVARQFTQVGNAVPPLLAYTMACAIYKTCYS